MMATKRARWRQVMRAVRAERAWSAATMAPATGFVHGLGGGLEAPVGATVGVVRVGDAGAAVGGHELFDVG